MGVVYLAEDTKLEREVAIKFLPFHIARNSDERKRFEIEAKKGIRILEDRNIIDSEMNYRFAHFYALIGDKENAIKSLKRSVDGGFFCYPYISKDPLIENIRDTATYIEILKGVKKRHLAFKEKYVGLKF
jgi:serine/threonine protein kinase